MPTVIPFIPETITVHLGRPAEDAANVTVRFPDYVKNVASSEIYPTWDEDALRANILAITSFALNRVYTEYYRSRGYPFEITSSTTIDQAFVNGRAIFENISRIVDELFNDYIRRQGFVEPLFASFCNGTTVTCDGLSQWGSEKLAQEGRSTLEILKNYYGPDIELVRDAPIQGNAPSYPGQPLRLGSRGPEVTVVQVSLNRIGQNYPAIARVSPVDGIYGPNTTNAVRSFQQIFGLSVDGIVGKSTWYQLVRLYVAVQRLAELNSEGQRFTGISWAYEKALAEGSRGETVSHLQYMLAVLGEFYPDIPPIAVDGIFGPATRDGVVAFQQRAGLEETGRVEAVTWNSIYDAYAGIGAAALEQGEQFPFQNDLPEAGTVRTLQAQLASVADAAPGMARPLQTGRVDLLTRQALRQFQTGSGLPAGAIDPATKQALARSVGELQRSKALRFAQYPGYPLRQGMADPEREV